MSSIDPKSSVEDEYGHIASTYHKQRDRFNSHELLAGFSSLLPPGGDLLDAGWGPEFRWGSSPFQNYDISY